MPIKTMQEPTNLQYHWSGYDSSADIRAWAVNPFEEFSSWNIQFANNVNKINVNRLTKPDRYVKGNANPHFLPKEKYFSNFYTDSVVFLLMAKPDFCKLNIPYQYGGH